MQKGSKKKGSITDILKFIIFKTVYGAWHGDTCL